MQTNKPSVGGVWIFSELHNVGRYVGHKVQRGVGLYFSTCKKGWVMKNNVLH